MNKTRTKAMGFSHCKFDGKGGNKNGNKKTSTKCQEPFFFSDFRSSKVKKRFSQLLMIKEIVKVDHFPLGIFFFGCFLVQPTKWFLNNGDPVNEVTMWWKSSP